MNLPTMAEAYNFSSSLEGIFSDLQKFDVPWQSENMAQSLDLAYLGLHSGQKTVVPFLAQLMLQNDGVLSADNRATIAQMLLHMYGTQWQKLWDTLSFEYNPIENYDMTETEESIASGNDEYDNTYTREDNSTDTLKQTGTNTYLHPTTTTRNSTNTAENSGNAANNVYGFNSTESAPSDNQTQSQNGKQTINETVTVEDNNTETRDTTDERVIAGTGNDTDKGKTTHSNNTNRTLTRHGNIGVTTSQQMIESERQLWIWNYFQNSVFPDIDKLLTLSIY